MHLECGHASVCENCVELRCFVCYYLNEEYVRISERLKDKEEEEEESGSESESGEEWGEEEGEE